MGDVRSYIFDGFAEGLRDFPDDALAQFVREEEARDFGLRAARAALAPAVWRRAVGGLLTTGEVVRFLGISRQALHKRVTAGTLIGLPGRGTTYFPAWQFDEHGTIRPAVRQITGVFLEEMGRLDPHLIAGWAAAAQEDLDGLSPKEWLEKGNSDEQIVEAATRAAARLGE
jgi:hypothetical protein